MKSKTPASFQGILVKNAREHNLKNVNVRVPRNQMTVITGLSGSGKSSLAFDTIYAEGQRRYMESLSAYARNFMDQMKKPEVDVITGLSPAIAIDQKSVGLSPRSTVGTITEVYDFLRLLFARVGVPHCPNHHLPVTSQTPQQIIEEVKKLPNGTKFYILAPMAQDKKGEFLKEFQKWFKKGFIKAKVDGQMIELENAKKLAKTKAHTVDLVVDQLIMKSEMGPRLNESINTALQMSQGFLVIETLKGERTSFSIHSACPKCGYSFPRIEPKFFSFNNPRGACPDCHGLGTTDIVEEEVESYLGEGSRVKETRYVNKSGKKVTSDDEDDESEVELSVCATCKGQRLRPEVLAVLINNHNIAQLSKLSAADLDIFFRKMKWTEREAIVADKVVKEICDRLGYLVEVGTGYLTLERPARTLSGGEAQRIRLASQLGTSLVGILYVLDEPSIGLHPRDHHRLLKIMRDLRDRGNTVLVVEHDEDTIMGADHVIDMGPFAGKLGGQLMAEGSPEHIKKNLDSLTGQYLSGHKFVPIPTERRIPKGYIEIEGATGNNLQNVNLKMPTGVLTSVTGVSGSGKSTLIIDTFYKLLAQKLNNNSNQPSPYKTFKGIEQIDKVIEINQRPIGRTPRSTPATYVGLFPLIRDLFAQLPESKVRGYAPGRFSFNVKGGRCEECLGHGQVRVAMHFMADVFIKCNSCHGHRFNLETLQIKYKSKSIADVLEMSVEEAYEFFRNHKHIFAKLETLVRVGLEYMTLGQSSTTLSGGEAQRVKLSKELSKRATGRTLYILDEPTTGLHFEDVKKLIELLQDLTDQGNSVVVIEHNFDVIKASDYIIDLGPEGGLGGGLILFEGTPEEMVKKVQSPTAHFLRIALKPEQLQKRVIKPLFSGLRDFPELNKPKDASQ